MGNGVQSRMACIVWLQQTGHQYPVPHISASGSVRTRESPGLEGEGHLCTCHARLARSSGCSHPRAREHGAQRLDVDSKLISTLLALHNDPTAFRCLSALGTHSMILC